ncbi:hypothetical protein F1654_08690 [Alkalicaulis satelles]|uniref:Uncharacterized protein n=1 Tax=Alkalicaulis satelles TaxID=2609175 RepID=A0A5M6ZIL1_9PROT|nr:hypothetical protein [Alkalicaulis satelles]KAA5803865.1 hypothetical protein F1654_08690 [Alkalicaulis satelles]
MTFFALLAIAAPAAACAGLALWLRAWLRALTFAGWMGWTLVGAGLPVLAGQLTALALAAMLETAAEACIAAGGTPQSCAGDPAGVILALSAGLAGGLGWAAGAISARLAPGARRE